jgi:DNA-binding NarL/FixJ family response regulator
MRVILADDALLIRQGLARLLTEHGLEVVAEVGNADDLLHATAVHVPDAVIVDIRMPPTFTDEGIRAAHELRAGHPHLAVLVLSQYVDVSYALKLIREGGQGLGYLLKDRVVDIPGLTDTLIRLARGECVIEPTLVKQLVDAQHVDDPLADLTPREREVLALMAGGYTDRGIRERLFLSQKTVESHVRSIFRKLDLPSSPTDNRRVHAALTYLRQTTATTAHGHAANRAE